MSISKNIKNRCNLLRKPTSKHSSDVLPLTETKLKYIHKCISELFNDNLIPGEQNGSIIPSIYTNNWKCPVCPPKCDKVVRIHEKENAYIIVTETDFWFNCHCSHSSKELKSKHLGSRENKGKHSKYKKASFDKRLDDMIKNPAKFPSLPATILSVRNMEDVPEIFPDFTSWVRTTIIHSAMTTSKSKAL